VSFQKSDALVLFCTRESNVSDTVSLIPLGIVRSSGDTPATMDFCKSFLEGAMLTIGWSSGHIQHLPMYFVPNLNKSNNGNGSLTNVVLNPELDFSLNNTSQFEGPLLFSPGR